jgi:pyruvate dehydrogenase E2 component (dihydrolipoamide acetyltransferase)
MAEILMPALGADMTEATLLEWHVGIGDRVRRGDIIATVDTAKSALDVEALQDGRIAELLASPGMTVNVGAAIARMEELVPQRVASPPVGAHRPPSSPLARRRAVELGIDLADIEPSALSGAIGVQEVERGRVRQPVSAPATATTAMDERSIVEASGAEPSVVEASGAEPSVVEASGAEPSVVEAPPPTPATGMREVIAGLMARSKREIPHYYLQSTIDIDAALACLEARNARAAVSQRILPAAVMLSAVAQAAREIPEVNGHFDDGFRPAEQVHLGLAISLRQGGVIAPAIHDADRLELAVLMDRMMDLVRRARAGRLRASELSESTMTVTILGDRGVDSVQGVIYPPQVALVGFGCIVQRPWAVNGMLTVRRVVTVTLAADHRVTDGHRGGQFLEAIATRLQDPGLIAREADTSGIGDAEMSNQED